MQPTLPKAYHWSLDYTVPLTKAQESIKDDIVKVLSHLLKDRFDTVAKGMIKLHAHRKIFNA